MGRAHGRSGCAVWRGQLAAPVNFGITEWVLCDPRSDPACSALVIASRGSSRGYSQEGKAKGQGAGEGGANVPSMDGWTVKRR